ncbi:MAG: hypothetical protein ACRDV1_14175 [Actinomycetes bacterium]
MSRTTTLRKETRKRARRANKKVAPAASDAREGAIRYAEATRDWAAPKAEATRDWAAPKVEPAVSKVKEDVLPKVAGAVAAALAASEPARDEAKTRGTAAIAALKGEVEAPKPKRHRVRKLFLLAGVLGAAYAGWKAWAAGRSDAPEPWATPATTSDTTGNVSPVGAGVTPVGDDFAGASPDEALADAAEEAELTTTAEAAPETETVTPKRARKVNKASEAGRSTN